MKKFKLEKPEEKLAILVTQGADKSPSFDSDTLRVTAVIVRVIPGDKIRNLIGDGNGLDNLQAPCRVYPQFDNNPFSWGQLNYENVYYVDASKAKLCYETLRNIGKGLERISKKWGRADSYGTFLIRLADVIGAEHIITYREQPSSSANYDDSAHLLRFHSPAEGGSQVNYSINAWLSEKLEKRKGAVA